ISQVPERLKDRKERLLDYVLRVFPVPQKPPCKVVDLSFPLPHYLVERFAVAAEKSPNDLFQIGHHSIPRPRQTLLKIRLSAEKSKNCGLPIADCRLRISDCRLR